MCIHYMHHRVCQFLDIYCALSLSNAVCPCFLCYVLFLFSFLFSFLFLRVMVRKTKAKKNTTSSFSSDFDRTRFQFKSNNDACEKLNVFRSVWAKRKIILHEVNPEIRRNFESWGWLPLLDVEYPLPTALIREFYLNLYSHQWLQYSLCEDLDKGWIVCHYPWGSGYSSQSTFGTAACVSLHRNSSQWWHHVTSHRYYH